MRSSGSAWLFTAALAASLPAQDARDVVTKTDGTVLHGRVVTRFRPDVVELQQDRERVAIPLAAIAGLDTVRDRVAEFLRLRDRLPDNARHRWLVVDWAVQHELPGLARLQALDVVLHEPEHAEAHRFLGHRLLRGTWRWPVGDEWLPFAEAERAHADRGQGWHIDGEHVRIDSNAPLRAVVDAALDLERLHQWWFAQFGEGMQLQEVTAPLRFWIGRDRASSPGLSGTDQPNFTHPTSTGTLASSSTWLPTATADRPHLLFEVATQHLIQATVADNAVRDSKHRLLGWADSGLAQYVQRCAHGPAGAVQFQRWTFDAAAAALVLERGETDLTNRVQRSSRLFDAMVRDDIAAERAAVHLLVAYLLSEPEAGMRRRFFALMVKAYREQLGTSSTMQDRELGRPIESFEKPWRQWLQDELAKVGQARKF